MTADHGDERDFWTIGSYLEKNYSKFAIMGIFGTVTVFLSSNFPGNTSSIVVRAGTFASLVIFGLAAVWIFTNSINIVLEEHNNGRSLSTELGFITLSFCTGVLCISIGVAITNFNEVFSIAQQIGIALLIAVIYIRMYPSERFKTPIDSAENIGVISVLSVFLIISIYQSQLIVIISEREPYVQTGILSATAAGVHLLSTEALLGIFKFIDSMSENSYTNMVENFVQNTLSFSHSYQVATSIAMIGFLTFTYVLYEVLVTGEAQTGWYELFGLRLELLVIGQLMALCLLVFSNIIFSDPSPQESRFDQKRYNVITLSYIGVLAVELALIYFNIGFVHVVTFG